MRTITILASSYEEALDKAIEEYWEEIVEEIAINGEVKIEYGVPHYYKDGSDYVIEEVDDFIIDKQFISDERLEEEYEETLEGLYFSCLLNQARLYAELEMMKGVKQEIVQHNVKIKYGKKVLNYIKDYIENLFKLKGGYYE